MRHLARLLALIAIPFEMAAKSIESAERRRREAFLAESVDHFDLECRIRAMERSRH